METQNQTVPANSIPPFITEEPDFCLTCHGTGRIFALLCHHCEGSGRWCEICQGIRLSEKEVGGNKVFAECVCRRDKRINRILDTRIPERCAAARRGFADFVPHERHPKQQKVFNVLRNTDKGLFLFGSTGAGKSHFGWLAFAEALRRGSRAFAANLDTLTDETTAYMYSFGEEKPPRPDLLATDLRNNDPATVFLDEIDKVKNTENALRFFFGVIDSAVYFGHRLILTSNVNPEILEEKWNGASVAYGTPISRRITESCAMFDMRLALCDECGKKTHIEREVKCVHCEGENLKFI